MAVISCVRKDVVERAAHERRIQRELEVIAVPGCRDLDERRSSLGSHARAQPRKELRPHRPQITEPSASRSEQISEDRVDLRERTLELVERTHGGSPRSGAGGSLGRGKLARAVPSDLQGNTRSTERRTELVANRGEELALIAHDLF